MIFWMLYAAGAGALLAAGGWACERLCETMGWPRRFPWLIAITLAVVIPLSARGPAPAPALPSAALPVAVEAVEVVQNAVASTPGPNLERAAAIVWGAASLATLAIFGTILVAMARSRRRWLRRSVDGEEVYISEAFGPALVGVAPPAVVIPEWLFCASERAGSVAILHEREHARARDHLALLYGGLIVALFPWSPAIWWMVRNLRGAVEIDCDRRVIASGITADDYGELLLAIGVGQHGGWAFAPALIESRHSLERRLKIMATKKMKRSVLRAAGLAGLSLAAVLMACETDAPTGIDDALVDLLGGPEAAADGDGTAGPPTVLEMRSKLSDGTQPLVFLDGVEVSVVATPTAKGITLSDIDPDDIDRIEVIKGPAAVELHGERAEGGVIQIYTKSPQQAEPPANDAESRDEPGGDAPGIRISGAEWIVKDEDDFGSALRLVAGTLRVTSATSNLTIEPTEGRSYDIDSRPVDWAGALEIANGLMVVVRQVESLGG